MAVVRAIINVLAACVLAWLAPISVGAATAAPSFVYTYDDPSYDQPTDYTASERGPPAGSGVVNGSAGQAAGNRGSPGTSARLDAGAPAVTYTYDGAALPARVATIPREERAEGPAGDISSIHRLQGAAKTVDDAIEGIGDARSYVNLTKGGSIRNVGTNTTHTEFAETLTSGGWISRTSKDGAVQIFQRNGAKYVLRSENSSGYAGWTADFTPAGSTRHTLEIRLGYVP